MAMHRCVLLWCDIVILSRALHVTSYSYPVSFLLLRKQIKMCDNSVKYLTLLIFGNIKLGMEIDYEYIYKLHTKYDTQVSMYKIFQHVKF
jgi:hypothetical protein